MDDFRRIPINVEFIDKTSKPFIDWTLSVPVIVSIASVVLVYLQARHTKKNNEEILKQQREIGEANIKADVVSKSRIIGFKKLERNLQTL